MNDLVANYVLYIFNRKTPQRTPENTRSTPKQSSHLCPLLPLMLLCLLQRPIIHLLHQILFIHHLISLTVAIVLSHTAVEQQRQQDQKAPHTMKDEP